MKKNYHKPSLLFENFTLMDAISSCEGHSDAYQALHANINSCAVLEAGELLFLDAANSCQTIFSATEHMSLSYFGS